MKVRGLGATQVRHHVRRALAAGVTTLFGIPGSGTSMSGFGVLYKTKAESTYEEAVFADPGGLKVAQDSNPQRGAGDLGVGRAALARRAGALVPWIERFAGARKDLPSEAYGEFYFDMGGYLRFFTSLLEMAAGAAEGTSEGRAFVSIARTVLKELGKLDTLCIVERTRGDAFVDQFDQRRLDLEGLLGGVVEAGALGAVDGDEEIALVLGWRQLLRDRGVQPGTRCDRREHHRTEPTDGERDQRADECRSDGDNQQSQRQRCPQGRAG